MLNRLVARATTAGVLQASILLSLRLEHMMSDAVSERRILDQHTCIMVND